MFELMERNIKLNELQDHVKAIIYDWGTSTPPDLPTKPDVVLAADCVYFEPAFPLLQQTLKDLLGENTICYFCFKKRRRADLQFIKTAKKMFEVKEVEDDPDKGKYSRENIYLFVVHILIPIVFNANAKIGLKFGKGSEICLLDYTRSQTSVATTSQRLAL